MSNQIATLESMEKLVRLVCSNRPRPSVQNNHSKGHQWWVRDIHHASIDTGVPLYHGAKTLCGRDASDYLIVAGPMPAAEAGEFDHLSLCKRCAAKLGEA